MNREKIIGPFTYPTRKAAEDAIRGILHNTPSGTALQGDEHDLVVALLHCHPDAARKVGAGIDRVEVRRIDRGAPGFWIVRADGTGDDFSYRKALDGAPSRRQVVHKALRRAVDNDVLAFRRQYFAENADADGMVTCPLTGLRVPNDADAHVDHAGLSFVTIADLFVGVRGGYHAIKVGRSPAHPGPSLADASDRHAWRDFHAGMAELRVVHRAANIARHRQGNAA